MSVGCFRFSLHSRLVEDSEYLFFFLRFHGRFNFCLLLVALEALTSTFAVSFFKISDFSFEISCKKGAFLSCVSKTWGYSMTIKKLSFVGELGFKGR